MSISRLKPAMAVVAAICLGAIATVAQADPAGKWRIQFDDRPDNDGTITFRITPEGGTPVDVETKITTRSSPNKVADTVSDSLKVTLGEGYHVETDDGEDVIIKRRGDTPKFEVTLASSSLTGLQVKIKRE